MPYAFELLTGSMIIDSQTGEAIHVQDIDIRNLPPAGHIATIKGHGATNGHPKVVEHSAARYVNEIYPAGSLTVYRGTFTDLHGLYRVRAYCTCESCLINPHDSRYVIDPIDGNVPLTHVRVSSLAISVANCPHCYPTGAPAREHPATV